MHLGVHNLSEIEDIDRLNSTVTKIVVNPDWNPFTRNNGGDLAILLLRDDITFTTFIRPVCLPSSFESSAIGMTGTIVGWGETENKTYEDIPRQVSVKVLTDPECYQRDNFVASLSSAKSFCGGYRDGNPSYGDSGGGFFVQSDNNWVQHGIISVSRSSGSNQSHSNSITVYTNVTAYKSWIVENVEQTGDSVGEVAIKINLTCLFGTFDDDSEYSCLSSDLNVQHDNTKVASVVGTHTNRYSNDDVEKLAFVNGSVVSLPNKIGTYFVNLKKLVVTTNLGLRKLKRSNFQHMTHVVLLQFFDSNIDTFDADALWDLANLKIFRIRNSKIVELNGKHFERNRKLEGINFNSNKLIATLPGDLLQNNPLLIEILLENNSLRSIDENIFANQVQAKIIDLSSNVLESLPENLLKNNSRLEFLGLSSNRLESIPGKCFENNLQLEMIDLAENSLKTLDDGIFRTNTKLTELSLSSNQLDYLPATLFVNCLSLRKVILSSNMLETVPEDIFKTNENLQIVDLSSNRLENLPTTLFASNSQLIFVDLHSNNLRALPTNLFQQKPLLKDVFLEFNHFETLPASLFIDNILLQEISLHNNFLRRLEEDTFKSNGKLTKLYLAHNRLDSLPKGLFENNWLLEKIVIDDNLIKTIDETAFESILELQTISVAKNELEILPKNLLKNNAQLVDASFHRNNLRGLDEDLFSTNRKLKNIYFAHNQIEALPKNIFRNNMLLRVVSFGTNAIEVLDEQLFEMNYNLRTLDLASNRLKYLPKNLFKNNLLLELVLFNDNSLQFIEIDFTNLQNVLHIQFYNNRCINSSYSNLQNLTQFQAMISDNCAATMNVEAGQNDTVV